MAREILRYISSDSAAAFPSAQKSLAINSNGPAILKLVTERQNMLRDAWMASIGYQRPGLPAGLPLDEALKRSDTLGLKIDSLVGAGKRGN